MPTQTPAEREMALFDANGPWVVSTVDRMLEAVHQKGLVGSPSESTIAVMTASAALTVAFSALRSQFPDDDAVRAMLAGMLPDLGIEA